MRYKKDIGKITIKKFLLGLALDRLVSTNIYL